MVEDLISTGGSSLKAVEALRESGANVVGLLALFTYGFEISKDAFNKANCPFYTITDYKQTIEVALKKGIIQQEQQNLLENWRLGPQTWGK